MICLYSTRSVHVSYSQYCSIYHRRIADLAAKYCIEGGRVLDIGCGTGVALELLDKQNSNLELYGADFDKTCLQRATERVSRLNTFTMDDKPILDISQLGKNYDICILSHVLEHIKYPLESLNKLLSITNAGGYIIIATPNPVRPNVFFWQFI